MNPQLSSGLRLAPLVQWLAGQGLPGADLEVKDQLLVLRLPPEHRRRLLADEALRRAVVSQAKALGFSRVALDLPPETPQFK